MTRICYECATNMPRNLYLPFFSNYVTRVVWIILVFSFVEFSDEVTLFAWLVSLSSKNAYMLDEQLSQSKDRQIFNFKLQIPDKQYSDIDDRRSVCWQRAEKVVMAMGASVDWSFYIFPHRKFIYSEKRKMGKGE